MWYTFVDFNQTFVNSVSWDVDELIRFCGQMIKARIKARQNVLKFHVLRLFSECVDGSISGSSPSRWTHTGLAVCEANRIIENSFMQKTTYQKLSL